MREERRLIYVNLSFFREHRKVIFDMSICYQIANDTKLWMLVQYTKQSEKYTRALTVIQTRMQAASTANP